MKKVVQKFGSLKKKPYLCTAIKKNDAVSADMAQLVEQRIRNAWVPGSSPGIGSTFVLIGVAIDVYAVIAQLVEH